jgi:hypothetical protein
MDCRMSMFHTMATCQSSMDSRPARLDVVALLTRPFPLKPNL